MLIKFIRNYLITLTLGFLAKRVGSSFDYYFDKSIRNKYGVEETFFVAEDGRKIPVYRDYRYTVKPGWKYFRGLHILSVLSSRGKIDPTEKKFLSKAIGKRTINSSLAEINLIARNCVRKNRAFFIEGSEDKDGLPEFLPDDHLIKRTINSFRSHHASMFKKLSAANVYIAPKRASVLEIGYISGGHSIQAFEQLGFEAYGIDNYYGDIANETSLHEHIKQVTQSNVNYVRGDITRRTSFPSQSFDIVYSVSVLEHIQDLEAAFVEMYRLLKPGGAIVHNYAPYFSHDGGHALGIGDSPWAHVRLNETEYLRYLAELRPEEAEIGIDWVKSALHRNMPQWRVQRIISLAGFRLAVWTAKPSPRKFTADLSPKIISECYENTPDIGIQDLTSQSVSFVAVK